jgi:hypothetical protein
MHHPSAYNTIEILKPKPRPCIYGIPFKSKSTNIEARSPWKVFALFCGRTVAESLAESLIRHRHF